MEYTVKDLCKNFNKDKSTVIKIIDYLKLNPTEKYHDKARKIVKFYSQDDCDKIDLFLKENPNTRVFFMKQTCLKRYGVEFSFQSEEQKKKTKETCLKKYGVDNPMKNEQLKSKLLKGNIEKFGFKCPLSNKEIMSKAEETCLKKYGTKNYNQSKSGKERKKNTLLKLYGVENVSQIKDVKLKKKNNYIEKCKKEINLLKDKYNKVYSIRELSSILNRDSTTMIVDCRKLNIDLKKGLTENFYVDDKGFEKLKEFFKITDSSGKSYKEKEICNFVKSVINDVVLENDKRTVGKELDIYIPSKNVAIEFDGLFWHSSCKYININKRFMTFGENQNLKNKHLDKTKLCEEKGIRLIHIFEDEWDCKQDICKSIICSSLGIYERKIFARKCEIKEIPLDDYKLFLNNNHIQGYAFAKYRLGLYIDNKLVQSVGVNKSSHKNGEMELNRMCTLLNTQVIGGFSKLMNHICDMYNLDTIYSYVSRRLYDGKGYYKSNFVKIHENEPTYFYVKDLVRYPRYKFMRNKIKKMYNDKLLSYWNDDESEEIIMFNNGYGRVYDCGTIKLKYTK